jgi:hypothetical protein
MAYGQGGEVIPIEQISLNFIRHVRSDVPAVQKVREAALMTPQSFQTSQAVLNWGTSLRA